MLDELVSSSSMRAGCRARRLMTSARRLGALIERATGSGLNRCFIPRLRRKSPRRLAALRGRFGRGSECAPIMKMQKARKL